MADFQRTNFCRLVGIEVIHLRSLDARGLLPFGVDQAATGRGYSSAEALLLMLMNAFVEQHGVPLARASEIAARLPPALERRWAEVVHTAGQLVEGSAKPVREVLGGRVVFAYPAGPIAVCGTGKQIEADVAAAGLPEVASLRISVSRVLALMISRAKTEGLRIPADFWTGPLKYRVKPLPMTPDEIADALTEKK